MLPNNYQYRDQQYQALRTIADNTQYPKEQRDYVRDISNNLYKSVFTYRLLERIYSSIQLPIELDVLEILLCGIFQVRQK